jgi:hypothetical protein
MEDGTPVYEDDAIVVFSITKPSTPWTKPQFAPRAQHIATCATRTAKADGAAGKVTPARPCASTSASESASDGSSDAEGPEDDANRESQDEIAEAGGAVETEASGSEEDEESSSDSDDETEGACLQNLKQQQLFRRMDALFSCGGTANDIVSNIRNHIAEHRSQSGTHSVLLHLSRLLQ